MTAPQPVPRTFPDEVVDAFRQRFERAPEVIVRAPGRVNLLGAHVDYNDGWVMPAAIDRAVWLVAAPASGCKLTVHALDFDQAATVDLDHLPPPLRQRRDPSVHWSDYPSGVAWALRQRGLRPAAMDAAFAGDVPVGAGVSSSAAVEMAFLLAWEALAPAASGFDGPGRARLGQQVENEYLDVQSGVMDQFASLHGAGERAIFLDCRDLTFEHVPLASGTAVLVADSGVRRRLADSSYNDRPRECRQALAILRRHLREIRALRDVSPVDFELHSHHLAMDLRRRVRHVIEECERVRDGALALRRGDLTAFGQQMRRSHLSSRDLYEVSLAELDVLAAASWSVAGCHGSRLVGGGFGGCVAALVAEAAVEETRETMSRAFRKQFGHQPAIFTCRVADGAEIIQGAADEP